MAEENWLRDLLLDRRERLREESPAPLITRATHRADAPGLPPLFACREADLLASLTGRGDQPHTISVHDSRTGWREWRAWP